MAGEREIDSCRDCPMRRVYEYNGSSECHADDDWKEVDCSWAPPPRWCPLRQVPITIRLKEGA